MIQQDGWRTGEYDETRNGDFVVETWPVEGGPIILAVKSSKTGEWTLQNYHGAAFTREDDAAIIRSIAQQQFEKSGWKF